MERRSSPVWSMVSELNSGEGVCPSGRGVALGSGKALGPAHGERGGVRWLDTDCVAGTEARCGGDNLPEANKKPSARTTSYGMASSYRLMHGVRGTRRLRHVVQRTTMLIQCEHACAIIEHSEATIGRSWCGGNAEGIFVRTPEVRG
jgi:hypothetical protein